MRSRADSHTDVRTDVVAAVAQKEPVSPLTEFVDNEAEGSCEREAEAAGWMSEGEEEWFERRQEEAEKSGMSLCPNVGVPAADEPPDEPTRTSDDNVGASSGSRSSGVKRQSASRQKDRSDCGRIKGTGEASKQESSIRGGARCGSSKGWRRGAHRCGPED